MWLIEYYYFYFCMCLSLHYINLYETMKWFYLLVYCNNKASKFIKRIKIIKCTQYTYVWVSNLSCILVSLFLIWYSCVHCACISPLQIHSTVPFFVNVKSVYSVLTHIPHLIMRVIRSIMIYIEKSEIMMHVTGWLVVLCYYNL